MSDLPGPEKPLELSHQPVANPNELMAEFRRKLALGNDHGPQRSDPRDILARRTRALGAGGSGPYTGRSGIQLKGRVRPRHEMVVMLQVAGWKNKEIADAMGYTEARVSVILNSKHPKLQAIRQQMEERVLHNAADMQAKFAQHAPTALQVMVDVMNQTADLAQRRLAARDVLDRAGYSPVKKTAHVHADVPFEQLQGVLGQIEKANETLVESDQWEVHDIRQDKSA